MVVVPVIRPFTHQGRAFTAGDTIRVSPVEAAVLHRYGYVSLLERACEAPEDDPPARVLETRALAPEPSPEPHKGRRRKSSDTTKRTYRRSDLTAEKP